MTTNEPSQTAAAASAAPWLNRKNRVLLVDDQRIVGETVRKMLETAPDIEFHFCQNPAEAIALAEKIRPTVILQDLVMPDIDGMTLVRFFQAHATLKQVPLVVLSSKEEPLVKAEAFGLGASDYLVKLPDRIELLARIRHHSQGYIHLLERNEAAAALQAELKEAERYMRTLLPPPRLSGGPSAPAIDWRLVTCTSLAGDALGYFDIDEDTLAFYVLDVCGHGVGAALLSVSVMNAIRLKALPDVDFRNPQSVLQTLNAMYPMEQQNNMYFTIWYGVWTRSTRTLVYASGGHPPAVWLPDSPHAPGDFLTLKTPSPMIGALEGLPYPEQQIHLEKPGRLYVFSDGVYEVFNADGDTYTVDDFVEWFARQQPPGGSRLDDALAKTRELAGSDQLSDDFTMLELTL